MNIALACTRIFLCLSTDGRENPAYLSDDEEFEDGIPTGADAETISAPRSTQHTPNGAQLNRTPTPDRGRRGTLYPTSIVTVQLNFIT